MKAKDLINLKDKGKDEIVKQVDKMRMDLIKEKAEYKAGKSNSIKKLRTMKKDIAQIMTIIREKEILEKAGSQKNNKKK